MSTKKLILAGTAFVAMVLTSPAFAGGFQRSIADTDILFEKGTFASRLGATYVKPNRGFETINGVSGDFGDYTGKYGLPSAAFYVGSDVFGCAANYVESFAAEGDYDFSPGGALPRQVSATTDGRPVADAARTRLTDATSQNYSRTLGTDFDSEEFSGTCRASYSTETMRFSLIGGVFAEDIDFNGQSYGERSLNNAFLANPATRPIIGGVNLISPGGRLVLPSRVDVDTEGDYELGFRIGAAVEMPEIALRVQALYRSEVDHTDITGGGTVTITGPAYILTPDQRQIALSGTLAGGTAGVLALQGLTPGTVIPITSTLNDSTSPQYLQLNAQTGIAPGTLLLGSFRWTDWSTNKSVISTISSAATGTSSSYSPYNWRDGYTASLGLGRAFNDQVSGAITLGYDRGVSTGSDTTYTDLYTISAGVSYKPASWSEIRLGGLVGFWSDGEQKISEGAFFDAAVGNDRIYGATASVKFTF
ncbi:MULTISPECIES: hypothetical protein [unclassified Aureimonas]|uniref:hypothetical protein n=1 Tax=unclassified Aureimonas TaxID=2615206 RepID=UPI0006F2E407|nr:MULTISPECIES: hypothetical protein [unclassified Aureimonas]KQT60535.1 hypothetical protein ASG62_07795 [Aureimonas sp. Leaf427]KQT79412.1 hypothetical protein ASG54_10395 [Aureimonas sp. Leaf460]